MKDIFQAFKFSLKSIIAIGVIFAVAIGTICIEVGFSDENKTTLSIVLISLLFLLFITYTSIVLILYYKLPKNKKLTKMGVLFYINSHGNKDDYNAIKDKFCEKFSELSNSIIVNELNLIILTEKQVSVIKNINDEDYQEILLKKTKCVFGVFIKATDEGRNSDNYELQMNAMIIHPELKKALEDILKNNFSYIFNGLRMSTLNKKNDLKDLQNLSTKLFYICQIIYAVANEYSKHYHGAIKLCNDILHAIEHNETKFYKQVCIILRCEICCCAFSISDAQYKEYVYNEQYDAEMVNNVLKILGPQISKLKIPVYTIDYHLMKSVYQLITNHIPEAIGEINILDKTFNNVKPNARAWKYSEAFLTAVLNNPKKYRQIDILYKGLKNNNTQDPLLMFDFINTYCAINPENLGAKIALLLFVKYKSLDPERLPSNLKSEVIDELTKLGNNDLITAIQNI